MGAVQLPSGQIIQIEGDEPTADESAAISSFVGEQPSIIDPPQPEIPKAEEQPEPTGEGPLGLVSPVVRSKVRETVQGRSGIMQLAVEMGPTIAGAARGGIAGAPLGPLGVIGGTIIGGLATEVLAQESGLAPRSNFNLAANVAGPIAGPALALTGKGIGKIASFGAKLPVVKAARSGASARVATQDAESLGTQILAKQRGDLAKTADELYEAARNSGVVVQPGVLTKTTGAMDDLIAELRPLAPLTEINQIIKVLNNQKTVLSQGDISFDTLIGLRSVVGAMVGKAEKAGGKKLGAAKKVFSAILDDMDSLGKFSGKVGEAAKTAQSAAKRAKLEFSVKELEGGVSRFLTQVVDKSDEVVQTINMRGFSKWLNNISNPKHPQFNKNFSSALADDLPQMKENAARLAKILETTNPGGPGALVIRSGGARLFRGGIGALFGSSVGGGVAAAAGGMIGANAPEMLVALLSNKPALAMVEKLATLGSGTISTKGWALVGTMLLRSVGPNTERLPEFSDEVGDLGSEGIEGAGA